MRHLATLCGAALLASCSGPSATTDDLFYVRSGGANMPVWVRGEAAAKTVIVHIAGGPGGPSIFFADTPVFVSLTQRALVAFWDQRGTGCSTGGAEPESLTLEQYDRDLDAVVRVIEERYDHPRIVLMGHSFGGLVGNSYLADPERQARISAWIYVDGVHNMAEALRLSRDWTVAQVQKKVDAGADAERWRGELGWYAAHPALSCPELSRHADTIAALDPEHNSWGADTGSPWLNLATPFDGMLTMTNVGRVQSQLSEVGSPLCRALMSDLTDALPKIALPSLVVWGRHDQGLPVATGEEALRLLGTVSERKSMVILEGSGHNSPYDEPEAFAQAVKAFLPDTLP